MNFSSLTKLEIYIPLETWFQRNDSDPIPIVALKYSSDPFIREWGLRLEKRQEIMHYYLKQRS